MLGRVAVGSGPDLRVIECFGCRIHDGRWRYKKMTAPREDESRLLAMLAEGDESALATLFSHHREKLWRMAHFRLDPRLMGRVDADDVLQESWLAATQRLDSFNAQEAMTVFIWFRHIVGQTMVDVHRRHLGTQKRSARREIRLHAGAPMASSEAMSAHLVDSLTSPSHAAMRDEAKAKLRAAIDDMEPIDREVLLLRHFEELSNAEVAETLDLQKTAASNRYVRALRRLKEVLDDAGSSVG
jgi:RNA polymerase sigma-70 factor (ECF subfamily)